LLKGFPSIAVSTYVWHGEQDQIVPVEQGRYLADAIPGCQGRFYPDGGHTIFLDYWNVILAPLVR
jgi:pimeloyl-ACP methyl ester carboxylesterase